MRKTPDSSPEEHLGELLSLVRPEHPGEEIKDIAKETQNAAEAIYPLPSTRQVYSAIEEIKRNISKLQRDQNINSFSELSDKLEKVYSLSQEAEDHCMGAINQGCEPRSMEEKHLSLFEELYSLYLELLLAIEKNLKNILVFSKTRSKTTDYMSVNKIPKRSDFEESFFSFALKMESHPDDKIQDAIKLVGQSMINSEKESVIDMVEEGYQRVVFNYVNDIINQIDEQAKNSIEEFEDEFIKTNLVVYLDSNDEDLVMYKEGKRFVEALEIICGLIGSEDFSFIYLPEFDYAECTEEEVNELIFAKQYIERNAHIDSLPTNLDNAIRPIIRPLYAVPR